LLSILLWISAFAYNPFFNSSFGTIKVICLFLGAAGILLATRTAPVTIGHGWRKHVVWLFALVILASLFRTGNIFETISGSLVFIGALVIGSGTAFAVRNDNQAKIQLMKTIVMIGVFQAMLGISQYYWIEFGPRVVLMNDKMKVVGTLGNPEFLAFFLGGSLLLAWHLPLLFKNARVRYVAIGILTIGLLFTASRVMWFALAFPLGLNIYSTKSLGRKQKLLIAVPVMMMFTGSCYFFHPNPHTFYGRLLIWAVSVNMIAASHGLGVGIGQYHFHFIESLQAVFAFINEHYPDLGFLEKNAAYADRAHSELLDFSAEGGILFSALGIFMLVKLFRSAKASPLSGFYKSFLTFSALGSLISFPLHIVPNLIVCVVLCACILSETNGTPVEDAETGRAAYGPKLLFASLFIGVGFQSAWVDFFLCKSEKEARFGNGSGAESSATIGLRLNPGDERLLIQKARLEYLDFRSREALRTLEAISDKPRTVDHYKLKGLALMSLKDFPAAEINYHELENAFPQMITPKYYLGRIALASGDKEKARGYFNRIQKLNARNEKAEFDKAFSKSLL